MTSLGRKTLRFSLQDWTHLAFSLPGALIYVVFFIIPVLLGFYYSLTDWNGLSKTYNIIGFKNYGTILSDGRLKHSLLFNLHYCLILVAAVLLLSLGIALLLESIPRFRSFFKSLYFFPAVLSLITVGLIFEQIFYRILPVIGKWLEVEFLARNILSSPQTAIYGILIVHAWQGIAIPIVLFTAGLTNIPRELYEVASIDGATYRQKLWHITLPYLTPIINIVFMLTLKSGLLVFDYIVALTGGGPGGATESIGLLIYKTGFELYRFSTAVTYSIVLFVIIVVITSLQRVLLQKKEVDL